MIIPYCVVLSDIWFSVFQHKCSICGLCLLDSIRYAVQYNNWGRECKTAYLIYSPSKELFFHFETIMLGHHKIVIILINTDFNKSDDINFILFCRLEMNICANS